MLHVQTRYVNEDGVLVGWPTERVYDLNMGPSSTSYWLRLRPILDFILDKVWERLAAAGEAHPVDTDKFKCSILSVDLKKGNEYEVLGMQDEIDFAGDVHLILWRKTYIDWLYELETFRRDMTHVQSGLPLDTPVATLGHGSWRSIAGIDSLTMSSVRGEPVTIDLIANPDITLRDLARLYGSPNSSDDISIKLVFA